MKVQSFFVFLILLAGPVFGQKIRVEPREVTAGEGEQFQVTYQLEGLSTGDFIPPDFKNLKVLSEPNQSNAVQMINGQISRTASVSYILSAAQAGDYTIGAAQVKSGSKVYNAAKIPVKILKGRKPQAQAPPPNFPFPFGNPGPQSFPQAPPQQKLFSQDEAFKLVAMVADDEIYIGQQLLVTYRLYSRVQVADNDLQTNPTFNGFWVNDVSKDNPLPRVELIYGEEWYVIDLRKYLLYPQKEGNLMLDPLKLTLNYQVSGGMGGFFQMFSTRQAEVQSDTKEIRVKKLPEAGKPADFSGAIGKFSLKAMADRTEVKQDQYLNAYLVLSGYGNFGLLSPPQIPGNGDWNVYDPSPQENTSLIKDTLQGEIKYTFALLPKKLGQAEIPALSYSYFDPETETYEIANSHALQINVIPGKTDLATSHSVSEEALMDIADSTAENESHNFPWKWAIGLGYLGLLAGFPLLYIRKIKNIKTLPSSTSSAILPLADYLKEARETSGIASCKRIKAGLRLFASDHKLHILTEAECASFSDQTFLPEEIINEWKAIIRRCDESLYLSSVEADYTHLYTSADKWIKNTYTYLQNASAVG